MGISEFIINAGIPVETLIYILSLPLIASLATLSRNVIGLKGFRIYIPIVVTYAFVALGIKYALILSAIVITVSFIARILMKKARIQYSSRMVLILTLISFSILASLLVSAQLGLKSVVQRAFIPALLIIALGEEFIDALLKQGPRAAVSLYIETIILAVAGYFLMTWPWYQHFILDWPIVIIFAILIVVLIGRWTGLRLTELWKFRDVAKAEADKDKEIKQ
jgi:hypothetical protein